MGYIAREYGVAAADVSFVGVIEPSGGPWRSICENHRAGLFDEKGSPIMFVPRPPVIELIKEFVHTDTQHNRQTHLFAGQCPDCGRVYVAESKFGIM